MEMFAPVLNVVSTCLDMFSIVILLWGIVVCGKDFFISRFKIKDKGRQMQVLGDVKNQLGTYVLFSLEVLIVADIVDTIVQPTLEDIIRLAAIVGIRTVISYFLNREIQSMPIKRNKD